ncbi:MAG: Gfo/Idh/MocA family oxidoreductase [Phycisphaerae bacterium]|nr:Gfo/Idh/MocA family oxidoreductase [Phycisphaerae bacterium]
MSASSKVRVGIVGTGRWARVVHAPGVVSHPEAELVAVCSRNRENAEAMARTFGVPHAVTDYRELIELDGLDAVIVATTNVTHHPICMAALERGLHVFCEKPLGMTLTEAREMRGAAERAGVKHMVAFTCRWLPHAMYLKELLAEGRVGRVYHVNVTKMAGYAGAGSPRVWRFDRALSGGGVLADLGVHMIDLARWYLGEIRSVCADARTVIGERRDPEGREMLPCEVDDAVAFLAEFASGVQGVFHISWVAHKGHEQTIDICGENGTLVFGASPEAWELSLLGSTAGEKRLVPIEVPDRLMEGIDGSSPETGWRSFIEGYPSMARRFIDTIARDESPSPSFDDGVRAQAVMEAVMRSSGERRWVAVEE